MALLAAPQMLYQEKLQFAARQPEKSLKKSKILKIHIRWCINTQPYLSWLGMVRNSMEFQLDSLFSHPVQQLVLRTPRARSLLVKSTTPDALVVGPLAGQIGIDLNP